MANLREIRKRIQSVKSTQQMTRAMKMVSGAKFRRAEMRIKAFRPYKGQLEGMVGSLLARDEELSHPLMQEGSATAPSLIILVSSNRGLCGGFNANILKKTKKYLAEHGLNPADQVFYGIGKKSNDYIRLQGWNTFAKGQTFPETVTAEEVQELSNMVVDAFLAGAIGSVTFIANHFINALTQETLARQVLPLQLEASAPSNLVKQIIEPDSESLFGTLLPHFVSAQIEEVLLDSLAGEHGARMTAMDSASNNASEVIGKLTLTYNRARQAAITSELLDIINGKNSIE